jgi:hypothetical protein
VTVTALPLRDEVSATCALSCFAREVTKCGAQSRRSVHVAGLSPATAIVCTPRASNQLSPFDNEAKPELGLVG